MKLQKKHLLWIMGVILILSLVLVTSCSPQQAETEEAVVEEVEEAKVEKADEPLRLVFVSPLIGHPAWLEAKRGSEAAAADYGFEIEWVGPSTIDMDAEIQLIESALATGADGILNCPLNPEAFTAVYQKAMDAGVPIVNVQVDTPEDSRLAFIGTGMVGYGQKAAEELAEKTGGKATIAVMQTSLDSGNQNAEFDAFKAVLDEKYPDMEIVVRETDNSDMVEAIDKINQILLAYPEVDAFLMLEGSAAPAAAQIFMEKKIDDIVVLGIDDLPETLQAIRDGYIWGTLTQNYYVMGYQGTEFILDHIAGKEVPSITDSGTTLVTSDNIDTYKDAGGEETEEAEDAVEEAAEAEEPYRFVFVSPLIGHPAWLEAKRGSEAAAADYGFEIEWVGPSTIDMDAEIQLIETALATGADGILNCPLNPEAFTAVYQQAMDAGVPIINVQVDTPEDTRLAFIGTGMVEYGQQAAEVLAEKMDGKATIAVMQTSLDSGNQNAEFDAFKAVLDEKYPDMEIVVRETDNSDMVEAIDKINQILLAYPEVDAFLMLEGSAAPAAAQIFMEKEIDDIVVLGIDDLPETLQAIRDGYIWGTLTQNYYVMGYQGTEFILDHIAGKEVPSITDSGTTLVTSDNIDTYNK